MNTDKRRRAVGLLAAALGLAGAAVGTFGGCSVGYQPGISYDVPFPEGQRVYAFEMEINPETRDVVSGDYRFAGDGSTIAQTAAQFTHNMNERGWTLDRIDQSTDKAALDFWKEPHGRWKDARVCLVRMKLTNSDPLHIKGIVRVGNRGQVKLDESEIDAAPEPAKSADATDNAGTR